MEADPQASHTIKHHKPTNQHSCHMAGNVLSKRTLGVLILYFKLMPQRKTGGLVFLFNKNCNIYIPLEQYNQEFRKMFWLFYLLEYFLCTFQNLQS